MWQKRIKNVHFEEKRHIRKFTVGTKVCAERDKDIKWRPDPNCNKSKDFPLGHDISQLSFQLVILKGNNK